MNIKLPEGFEQNKYFNGPSFEDGHEILSNYCRVCSKKTECEMNETLRSAMGNDFPYWSESFVSIEWDDTNHLFLKKKRVLCYEYENPQLKIPGIELEFPDGINRLVEIVSH